MLLKSAILAVTLLMSSAPVEEHPLKMSFSKLVIGQDGIVDLETRIFLDDLTEHMERLFLLRQADFSDLSTDGTQVLQLYLKNHFYFEQEGQQLDLFINGVSLSKNSLALVVNTSTAQPLDVSKYIFLVNTLLCDASPVQKNDIKYLDKHYMLGNGKPKMKIQLD
ncbi:MAG: DUF6702 family protein [Bacteroidota bacterium]